MSTAIQRRGRPGLTTLIEKFPLILFLALLVWLSVQSPYFLSWQNISLMLVQSVPLAILCFGLVCVIAVGGDDVVSGGIDLSLPATAVLGVALLSLGLAEWHTPYLLLLALLAAAVSIVVKEILYRYTVREGRRVSSPSMIANAWHHRSDALSSLGTLAGIGCAYFLGDKWRIADPIAALVVAVFIFKIAFDLIRTGLDELLERSLPEDVEEEILRVVAANPEVREPHNLRTRRIGASIAVEVHVRVDGAMSVCRSHELTEDIERRLRARFGEGTMIAIHVEPLKAACRAE